MKSLVQSFIFASGLLIGGCMTTQAKNAVPALLKSSSAETTKIIQQAITSLTNMQNVRLADNVFSQKSTLIIERAQHKDSQGRLLNGREIEPADTFTLLSESGKCYLRHNQSDKMIRLTSISCATEQ